MTILLATGKLAYPIVKESTDGFDVKIAVSGKIAAFLTPAALEKIIAENPCDMVLVSGMCTADFSSVEEKTKIPVFRGPRHAADLGIVLKSIGKVKLSRTTPADELISESLKKDALGRIESLERDAGFSFEIKGLKFGGNSRMKVLAEIMDAHKEKDLKNKVISFFKSGADIVDLGFGFDALPEDVTRAFESLKGINEEEISKKCVLAADTQNPELIKAALPHADIILSLHEENIPVIAKEIAGAKKAAVIVPMENSLENNILCAKEAGIEKIIADPLLMPVGSGLVKSLSNFKKSEYPLFFGAGNVTELIDADSPGVNALLCGMAKEAGASVIFTSEHSDKTKGAIREMRRAVEMMTLMTDRPYPKDLGLSLFCIKEKRKRVTPALEYENVIIAEKIPDDIEYDPLGNLRIGIEGDYIVAVHKNTAYKGKSWEDVFYTLLKDNKVSLMDHAAYLGKELYKAELSLKFKRSFDQDGPF